MTGVTVVSTFDKDDTPWGVTANSFTSVSLDPAIVLVCIGKQGRTYPTFERTNYFAINILAAKQLDIAKHFASQNENRFETIDWHRAENGAPLINDATAWLDCEVHKRIDAGSHEILMGQVIKFGQTERPPLGYCQGQFIDAKSLKELPHV